MRVARLLPIVLLAALAPGLAAATEAGAAHAEDLPAAGARGGVAGAAAPWVAKCMAVQDIPGDTAPAAAAEKGCDAQAAYYAALDANSGADWDKVRACALAEGDDGVLMMLYANGLGVKRDLRRALRHACALGGAPAELEGRVEHLSALMQSPPAARQNFDLCDDITSGYMQGVCAHIASVREAKRRGAELERLAAGLAEAQRPLWDRLQKAHAAFAEARGTDETDMSGTARAALAIMAEDAERDTLAEDLRRCARGEAPKAGPGDYAAADAALNAAYKAVMRAKTTEADGGEPGQLGYSTITRAGVQKTQKLWLKYRDAWAAYAKARCPEGDPEAWSAQLTRRRAAQLEELRDMAGDGE